MKHAPLLKLLSGAALALALLSSPAIARDRHGDQGSKDTKQALYPNATRKEPKLDLTSEKEQKKLNDGLEAVNAGDKAKAMQLLQPIAADQDSSKYAQSLALQGIANIKYNDGDVKGAIDALKHSLQIGVLPNDTYFQLEYELAQFYLADEQYQQSIDTVEKWRSEGKRETAESYALEGNAYYRLEKYPEAITAIKKAQSLTDKPEASWNQILMASYAESGQSDQAAQIAQQQMAANPNDPTAFSNAIAVLMQAQKYPQAIQLMEKARAAGSLKDENDYVNLAKLYYLQAQDGTDTEANAGKAEQVLEEGLGKGIIKPSADIYNLQAGAAYMADDTPKALAAYRKAIPLSKNGDPALAAGTMLLNQNKYSEAAKLIQQAIDKGVKKQGAAYMSLAEAKRGLKDKAGAVTAMKKAAQYPDTAAKAQAWLKKAGAGK